MGQEWARKIQLGVESTPGTAVAATTIWRGEGAAIKDDTETVIVPELVGIAIPTNRSYQSQLMASCAFASTPATFEQLPYIFEAGVAAESPTQDGTGSDYIYAYQYGDTSITDINTYTIETGDNQQAREMEYAIVTDYTLSGAAGEAVMMEANWVGRQATDTTFTGALSVPSVDEILAGQGNFYIDAVGGSFGGTAVTGTLLSWSLSVTTGWNTKFTVDQNQLYFDFHYFDKSSFSAELELVYEHDGTAVTEYGNMESETPRLFRIEIVGPTVATPGTTYSNKTLLIDAAGKYTEFSELDAEDGNSIVTATAFVGHDLTASAGLAFTVVNELSALP